MLKRYLPDDVMAHRPERATGWTSERYDAAKALILTLRDHHDRDATQRLPHQAMIDVTGERLRESDLAQSLAAGWTLARDVSLASGMRLPLTPMTRIAPPIRVFAKPRDAGTDEHAVAQMAATRETVVPLMITRRNDEPRPQSRRNGVAYAALAAALALALGGAVAHQNFPTRRVP